MKNSAHASSSFIRQNGAVSVAIVILLVFILGAAVMAITRISGTSLTAANMNEAQTAALSLAESGLERAQAILTAAAKGGTYTNTTCTGLSGASLGRGSFDYTSKVSTPATCGGGTACTSCTVTAKGIVGDSSRSVRAVLIATTAHGAEGNGSDIPLDLIVTAPNAGVVTNLAFPSDPTNNGSTAVIGTCTNPANCASTSSSNGWNVTSTSSKNQSDVSVYENASSAGTYTIKQSLVVSSSNSTPAPRNYVQVGAVFYPTSGNSVSFAGTYGTSSGSYKTAATSTASSGGSIPANWNCAPQSGTATASAAANANVLVYGFSALPSSPTKRLNGVSIGGEPMTKIRDMSGTQGDNLYSQIWYAKNDAYLSGSGSTSGAVVTGWAGTAKSIGEIKSNNTSVVCLKSFTTSSTVSSGMNMRGSGNCPLKSGTKTNSTIQTTGQALCNCNGGSWSSMMNKCTMGGMSGMGEEEEESGATYTGAIVLNQSQSPSSGSGGTVIVDSDVFTVTSASKPFLEVGDTIYGDGVAPGTKIKAFKTGSGGTGTYQLTIVQGFEETDITSNGTIISTSGTSKPTVGQLVAVSSSSSTGSFQPQTTVLSSPSPTTSKYRVSDRPSTPLSGAQICGGVCAFFDNDGTSTPFTLTNITSSDDWSSGFTCLKNADPSKINPSGETLLSQRSQWSEVVQ